MAGVVDLLQTPAEETSKNAAALHEAAVKSGGGGGPEVKGQSRAAHGGSCGQAVLAGRDCKSPRVADISWPPHHLSSSIMVFR